MQVTGPERSPYRPDRTLFFARLSLINSTPPCGVPDVPFSTKYHEAYKETGRYGGRQTGNVQCVPHEVGEVVCWRSRKSPQVTLEGTRAVSRAPRPSPGHCSVYPLEGSFLWAKCPARALDTLAHLSHTRILRQTLLSPVFG